MRTPQELSAALDRLPRPLRYDSMRGTIWGPGPGWDAIVHGDTDADDQFIHDYYAALPEDQRA